MRLWAKDFGHVAKGAKIFRYVSKRDEKMFASSPRGPTNFILYFTNFKGVGNSFSDVLGYYIDTFDFSSFGGEKYF